MAEDPSSRGEVDTTGYSGTSKDKTSLTEELQDGPAKTIQGIVDATGICAARVFLESLSAQSQAQFKARFERYCQVGYLRSPNEWRMIHESDASPRVHEIKTRNGYRLFGVELGDTFFASHGAKKPKKNKVAQHAERARKALENMKGRERQ